MQVKPVARHFGGCGVAKYVIDNIYDTNDLAYLKRCGMKPEDVQRPPRSGDWHGLLPEEIPEGQHRVVVNLDTLEYIDPVKFGQIPTLAGMVSLAPWLSGSGFQFHWSANWSGLEGGGGSICSRRLRARRCIRLARTSLAKASGL